MPKSSLEELRGQISAGEYAIDSGTIAGDMLSKFALVRRVRATLLGEDVAAPGRARLARRRNGTPAGPRRARPGTSSPRESPE